MSTRAVGRVVDLDTGSGVGELSVALYDITALIGDARVARAETEPSGEFELEYGNAPRRDLDGGEVGPRVFRLCVHAPVRVVWEQRVEDVADATLSIPTIRISGGRLSGWLVTDDAGTPTRLTRDNAVRWLVDNEDAWAYTADVIHAARQSLDIMQLDPAVAVYEADECAETPKVVLAFGPRLDRDHDRPLAAGDRGSSGSCFVRRAPATSPSGSRSPSRSLITTSCRRRS